MVAIRYALLCLAAFSTFGCVAWKRVSLVDNPDPSTRPPEIQIRHRGADYVVHHPVMDGDTLRGWIDKKRTKSVAIAVSEIERARVEQVSGERTALLIVGLIVLGLGFMALLIDSAGGIAPDY